MNVDMLRIVLKRSNKIISGIVKLMDLIRYRWTDSRLSIADISNRVPVLAESLEKTFKATEHNFMQTGQEFQSVISEATELAKGTSEIAKLFTGDSDENLLDVLGRLIRQSVSGLKTGHTGIAGSLKIIDAGAEYLGTLHHMSPQIERTASFLHIVGLNIGIESSRSEESREMFDIFVHEIKQLASKIVEISQGMSDGAKRAKENQSFAQEQINEGLNKFGSLTIVAEETVKVAVDEISQLMNRSVNVLEKVGRHSKEISRQAGEIVVAIQFNDIARQQIEHISAALIDAGRMLNGVSTHGSDGSGGFAPGRAQAIISLQKAQLRLVINEIDDAHRNITNAFSEIGNEVDGLVKSGSTIGGQGGDAGCSEDSFAELRSGIEHLHGIITQGHEMGYQMRDAADQASSAASSLSQYVEEVRSISLDLHLKALNAIIKSTHLGEKYEALEVLSHEVTRLSHESDAFIDGVLEILGSMNDLALEMTELSSKEAGRQEQENNEIAVLNENIRKISYSYSRLEENSQTAISRSQGLKATVTQARDSLGFLPELSGRLLEYLDELDEIDQAVMATDRQEGNLSHDDVNDVAQRYTMESERDVARQKMLSVAAKQVESRNMNVEKKVLSSPIEMFEEDTASDLNIEMFEDDPATDLNIDMFGYDQVADSNIEMFESTSSAEVEKPGEEENLGDTVELF